MFYAVVVVVVVVIVSILPTLTSSCEDTRSTLVFSDPIFSNVTMLSPPIRDYHRGVAVLLHVPIGCNEVVAH